MYNCATRHNTPFPPSPPPRFKPPPLFCVILGVVNDAKLLEHLQELFGGLGARQLHLLLSVAEDEVRHPAHAPREPLHLLIHLAQLRGGGVQNLLHLGHVEAGVFGRLEEHGAVARRLLLAEVRAEDLLHERVLLVQTLLLGVSGDAVAVQRGARAAPHGEPLDACAAKRALQPLLHARNAISSELLDVVAELHYAFGLGVIGELPAVPALGRHEEERAPHRLEFHGGGSGFGGGAWGGNRESLLEVALPHKAPGSDYV
mmetsp:Transcript_5430/g.13790  ORF Transcript_5430/g.13790 Transcript_5430/m.13790 type:complete len:259 (+) Transcript_5430:305-1081(+)